MATVTVRLYSWVLWLGQCLWTSLRACRLLGAIRAARVMVPGHVGGFASTAAPGPPSYWGISSSGNRAVKLEGALG